jgi:hypothetical protein
MKPLSLAQRASRVELGSLRATQTPDVYQMFIVGEAQVLLLIDSPIR